MGLTAASSARRTRWGKALSYVGGIVVLTGGAACTAPMPDAVPQDAVPQDAVPQDAVAQDAVARADGPYIAARPETFEGNVVGAGHCVDFVKAAADAPRTAAWQEGAEVRGNPDIARGTAIATFAADGTYTNESGNHAAIYLYQDDRGIWVYDQWQGQPVHRRLIRFEGGKGSKRGSKSNDGKRFAVIE